MERGPGHADRVGDLLHRVLPTGDQVARDAELVLGDHAAPAAASPAGALELRPFA